MNLALAVCLLQCSRCAGTNLLPSENWANSVYLGGAASTDGHANVELNITTKTAPTDANGGVLGEHSIKSQNTANVRITESCRAACSPKAAGCLPGFRTPDPPLPAFLSGDQLPQLEGQRERWQVGERSVGPPCSLLAVGDDTYARDSAACLT